MSESVALEKDVLFESAAQALVKAGRCFEELQPLFVPGRIEVLGKHTDYCGGRSVLCASQRGLCVTFTPRPDKRVRIFHVTGGSQAEFDVREDLSPQIGHWSNYPMTVVRRVARNFPIPLRGFDLAIHGDLPPAAGLSSSSALVVAIFLAMSTVNELPKTAIYQQNIMTSLHLAGYLGCVENGRSFGTLAGDLGVGTSGGSQDHTAILECTAGRLSYFDFHQPRLISTCCMPESVIFVIAVSGVIAEKTGAAMGGYNRASQRVGECLRLWKETTGEEVASLAELYQGHPDAGFQLQAVIRKSGLDDCETEKLIERCRQFEAESFRIIPAFIDALSKHQLDQLGPLTDESQSLAARYLHNQVPETVYLASSARELGAIGASAFGAGFGGSVWAIVARGEQENFISAWRQEYLCQFPARSSSSIFFTSAAGPAAMMLPQCN